MNMYTVTAGNCYNTITAKFRSAQDAFQAAFWYGWDRSSKVTSDDGRQLYNSITHETADLTNEELAGWYASHYAYYHKYDRTAPRRLLSFVSESQQDA